MGEIIKIASYYSNVDTKPYLEYRRMEGSKSGIKDGTILSAGLGLITSLQWWPRNALQQNIL